MAALGRKLQVLLVGEQRFEPFPQAFEAVCEFAGDDSVLHVLPEAMADPRILIEDYRPDLVVVVQSWPDQYSVTAVNHIMTQFAQAKILCCYGQWCDSDGRNRSIWPLAVRVPAQSLARRLALESSRRNSLPLTASRTEIFEFDLMHVAPRSNSQRLVEIDSPDRPWREMIAAELMRQGFQIWKQGQAASPDLILFDSDPWGDRRRKDFSQIHGRFPSTPIVACCGLPNADLTADLALLGCQTIWFKLTFLDDLTNLACRLAG